MYPAVSPNVLAVGGTTLSLNGGTYSSESGWSGSTGGFSGYDSYWWSYESQPSYQNAALQASGLNYGVRTTPDVSFNADPNSGVSVYDSTPYSGQSGWFQVGGTSAAAPAWSGLIAITNQGLATARKAPLSGTQAQTQLYSLPTSDFHDITSGSNGYAATPGYDLVTGLGSPKANLVVAGLLSANGVSPAAATTQVTVATPTKTSTSTSSSHHTASTQSNLSTSSTGGTATPGGSSNSLGTSSASSNSQALIGLSSTGQLAGPLLLQALSTTSTSITTTQVQPTVQPASSTAVATSGPASAPSFGQSLLAQPSSSPSIALSQRDKPGWLVEDTEPVPSPTAVPIEAPTPDQVPAPAPDRAPAVEAPFDEPLFAPAESTSSLEMDRFDLALHQVSISMAARRLEPVLALSTDLEQPREAQASWNASILAGTAALAAGGYRLVLGRSDRIRRRWLPGRFA
jgi:hypothetical protein